MAGDFRRMRVAPCLCLLALSHAFAPVQAFNLAGIPGAHLRQPPARLDSIRAGPPRIHMGLQDSVKHKACAFKAAVAILGAAWMPRQSVAAPPPMQNVYPASYYMQQAQDDEELMEMHPVAKFVTDKRFLTTVGVGVVAGGAVVAVRKWQKKSMENYRKKLSTFSDIKLDTSILDEARINRPGARTVNFSNAPTFGSYRPPPEKKMKGVKDKYVWNDKPKKDSVEDLESKLRVNIFDNSATSSTTATRNATQVPGGVSAVDVEVVGAEDGPKTMEEKAMVDALGDFNYDELMNQAMMDPNAMDPSVMAAALPKLQEQMAAVLKEGVNPEDVEEVRASFREMGIDLEELFSSIEDLEKAGLASDTLGKEGVEFFRTLRQILMK